ncbi:MAG: PEP-CTERM sorting domain-containing protein [Armatimonadetes bacterium]|nr:PEP-CTERM sorting domain-containing protein [Armatimonadota bacterium]
MKRLLTIAAVFGLGTSAFASFDLVFVADTGTDSIHRFDGDTGVYLGSFGAGFLIDPMSMAIDQANNRITVTAGNGVFQMNLWNGNLLNMTSTGNAHHAMYVAENKMMWSYSTSQNFFAGMYLGFDGAYIGQNMPATSLYGGIGMYGNFLLAVDATNGRLRTYNYGGFGGNATLNKSYNMFSTGITGQLSVNSNGQIIVADGVNNRLHTASVAWADGTTMGFNPITELVSVSGAAFAHNGFYYASGRNAANTSGLLVRRNSGYPGTFGTYGSGILQQPRDVAVIAAPEPAQFAAIGLGILGILFKKRKKA